MSQKRLPEESDGPRRGRGGGAEPGGSSSSLPRSPGEPKRQRVPALRDVITEVMRNASMERFFIALEPLIRRVAQGYACGRANCFFATAKKRHSGPPSLTHSDGPIFH